MRRALALLLLPVLVAACNQSRVDPDAAIRIEGAVRNSDGTPLANRPVTLGAGIGNGDVALALLTFGLSCTTGSCSGAVFDTETGPRGRYAFDLKGSDTQSMFGEAVYELLSTSAAPGDGEVSGAAIAARFEVQVERVQLPTLRLVDPGLVVRQAAKAITTRWSSRAASGPYEVTFEQAQAVPVWQVTTARSDARVDARVLEDTSGRVVVSGQRADAIEGSDLAITWRSPGIAYASAVGAPPSRGAACRIVARSGAVNDPASPCELTDGDLTSEGVVPFVCRAGSKSTSTTACEDPAFAVIELDSAVPAELAVVRGCQGGCPVAVSADGRRFRAVRGAVTDGFGAIALGGAPIRFVRVGLGDQLEGGLREVSVWGRAPEVVLRPLDDEAAARERQPFVADGPDDDDDGLPVLPIALAAIALAACLVGLGFFVGRRR